MEHEPRAVEQACSGCSEPTAAGSALFSDRRAVDHPDGRRSYVCGACHARLAAARRGARLTDDEIRRAIDNGSMAGMAWSSGGPPGGI